MTFLGIPYCRNTLTKDDVSVELAKISKILKAADAEMAREPEENREEENDNGEA